MAILFKHFIDGLYRHPWLKRAIFVLFVERNISAGPYVVEQVMQQGYDRHYIITDRVRNISGVWTDRFTKSRYVITGAAHFREDKISIMTDLVCMNPWLDAKTRADITIQGMLEEIPRFRLREPPPGSSKKLPIMSGKIDENGRVVKGLKDDKAFTLFMSLTMMDDILKESIPGLDYRYIKQEADF